MRRTDTRRRMTRREAGYALLMVVFFTALVLIAAATISPKVLTQGRREKEEETVWRGQQYVRGIRMYYRKAGRYPQSLEDLTKPKTGIRFMRQAYKDPMNGQDGSWRLIYVGPAGQLIGSVKRGASVGRPVGVPAQAIAAGSGRQSTQSQKPPEDSARTYDIGLDTLTDAGQPSATPELGAPGTIIGGNIIGVASRVNRRSIRLYDGEQNYRAWEFIWDPSKNVVVVGQPGQQVGAPAGNPAGTINKPNPQQPQNPHP